MASTGEVVGRLDAPAIAIERPRRVWSDAARVAGGLCAIGLTADLLVLHPQWPAPDRLLVITAFGFMAFGQALALLRRLLPFCALLLAYESFRGLAPYLNHNVHFTWMTDADRWLFRSSELPTLALQRWLWQGSPSWYDYLYYVTYMSHFVFPVAVVILTWKFRPEMHRFVIAAYVVLTSAGYGTYLLFPAAPPWIASIEGVIPPIVRVHAEVRSAMELESATTLWTQVPPNVVAAVPSLHAAYAVLFVALVWRLFGARWGMASLPYPLIIFVGTVYAGEHYAVDELLGALYGLAAFLAVSWWWSRRRPRMTP